MIILFLGDIGGGEMILIMLVILLFFGSKNIPSLARGLGKGIREFRDATSGIQREIEKSMYENPAPPAPKAKSITPIISPVSETKETAIERTEEKPQLPIIEPASGSVPREE